MKKFNALFLFFLPVSFLFLDFTTPAKRLPREGKDFALLFVVGDYNEKKLVSLKDPKIDAEAIKKDLEDIYGFKCQLVFNPTAKEIRDELRKYASKFKNDPSIQDGQLLLFFSGHGERDESNNGYFLTKDTDLSNMEGTAFSYSTGRNIINNILCKHILVAIDACKSGAFDPASERGFDRGNEMTSAQLLIQEAAQRKTRWFLSSSAKDKNSPEKSDFAYNFLEALRSNGNVKEGRSDNILTLNELQSFLEDAHPKPVYGKFGDNVAGSTFLFLAKNADSTIIKSPKGSDMDGGITKGISPTTSNELIALAAATFDMGNDNGAPNQRPSHQVKLPAFYISKFEVTFEEYETYRKAINKTNVTKPSDAGFGMGRRPVINVSWLDAVGYCNWLSDQEGFSPAYQLSNQSGKTTVTRIAGANGYRLPTESEWEFAATSNKHVGLFYSGSDSYRDVANTQESFKRKTETVGAKQPNGVGAHDMSGNVWEWVEDCWEANYTAAPNKGEARLSGNCDSRVVRGGSWMWEAKYSSVYSRQDRKLNSRNNDVGFRVARSQ
jgi:formylglycine-generating enzyme required for sulfatase activity